MDTVVVRVTEVADLAAEEEAMVEEGVTVVETTEEEVEVS